MLRIPRLLRGLPLTKLLLGLPRNVDASRVYLTGLSMGGYGTWAWAAHAPHRFAAIAPVCGGWGSDETRAAAIETLKALPHWVTHAANDKIVPVATSDSMVEELKAAGAEEVVYRRYETSPAPYQPTDDSPVRPQSKQTRSSPARRPLTRRHRCSGARMGRRARRWRRRT